MGNADLTDQIRNRQSKLRLFQNRDDLLNRKPFPLHGRSPLPTSGNPPEN
jgi:hypothetical protein